MLEPTDLVIALYVILIFVVFISGLFLGASISPNRRKERGPWYARAIAAAESISSSMPQHVSMDREWQFSAGTYDLDQLASAVKGVPRSVLHWPGFTRNWLQITRRDRSVCCTAEQMAKMKPVP